jgi:hypothetical protein
MDKVLDVVLNVTQKKLASQEAKAILQASTPPQILPDGLLKNQPNNPCQRHAFFLMNIFRRRHPKSKILAIG